MSFLTKAHNGDSKLKKKKSKLLTKEQQQSH